MYKAWIKTTGDTTWSTNSLSFDTVDGAISYAKNLFGRWLAVEQWAVISTADATEGYYLIDQQVDDTAVARS